MNELIENDYHAKTKKGLCIPSEEGIHLFSVGPGIVVPC